MNKHQKTPGECVDELETNARRLDIAHVVFGIASAFDFLSRPGVFHPSIRPLTTLSGGSLVVILHATVAWIPYVLSWAFARRMLAGRGKKATLLYIGCATAITLISFVIHLPISSTFNLTALLFSGILSTLLVITCGICAMIGPSRCGRLF